MPSKPPGSPEEARPHRLKTRMLEVLRASVAKLPPLIGYWVADRLGDVTYFVAPKSRSAVISNQRHVLGRVSKRKLKRSVRGVFNNVMRDYYDLCRIPDIKDKELERVVQFDNEGWQRVVDLHDQGRGVILVSAHFGAFDLFSFVLSRQSLPVSTMIAQFKPAWLSDFISGLRASRGLSMILVDEEEGSGLNLGALKRSVTLLRKGEVLGVFADRNLERQGLWIPFFGHRTLVASGVAKMALRTGSPIVTSFCVRLKGNRFRVIFDEPIEPDGSSTSEEDLKRLLRQIFARLEMRIREHPEQWMLLQPVWPAAPEPQS